MAKQVSGRSEAQTSTTTARPEATGREPDRAHAALGELVQRLARDGRPGARGVRNAALALQRFAGNQATARMLGARSGGATRSVGDVARAGFQGTGGRLPHMARIQAAFGASHHAGIEHGFMFKAKHHKGLGLLDLPSGCSSTRSSRPASRTC